ncbi:hypothetical protein GUITHDRAFT_112301 [Guillardia theta CCMP2712]|uniref:IPT/TIG domain-containing protein n=1 Tax=Guillardia theta (strain CCMP2712) TaxID=905079 RepID=L1IZB9_GUITC|nr:hypothetical protein GUITHDRAFT_112301 [Guillardia theta CCMP2712]EKX41591.1 hypothetical protein GUITHDRAFT_112301 [Guillardia theta CCMP2712]|eukprot:XP_005828571.1 hypothetical protein GUITHDRAFT_112301 [Guillardia theta CCMP2712]
MLRSNLATPWKPSMAELTLVKDVRQGTFVQVRVTKERGNVTEEYYLMRGGMEYLEQCILKRRLEDSCKALEMENELLTQKIVQTSLASDPSSCTSFTKENLADARLKVSTLTNILHYESVSTRTQSSKLIQSYQTLLAAKARVKLHTESRQSSNEAAEDAAWRQFKALDAELVEHATSSTEPYDWATMSWRERLATCQKFDRLRKGLAEDPAATVEEEPTKKAVMTRMVRMERCKQVEVTTKALLQVVDVSYRTEVKGSDILRRGDIIHMIDGKSTHNLKVEIAESLFMGKKESGGHGIVENDAKNGAMNRESSTTSMSLVLARSYGVMFPLRIEDLSEILSIKLMKHGSSLEILHLLPPIRIVRCRGPYRIMSVQDQSSSSFSGGWLHAIDGVSVYHLNKAQVLRLLQPCVGLGVSFLGCKEVGRVLACNGEEYCVRWSDGIERWIRRNDFVIQGKLTLREVVLTTSQSVMGPQEDVRVSFESGKTYTPVLFREAGRPEGSLCCCDVIVSVNGRPTNEMSSEDLRRYCVSEEATLTAVSPSNVPCVAQSAITVYGGGPFGAYQGFGNQPSDMKIRFIGTACDTTQWISLTSATCKLLTSGFAMGASEIVTNIKYTIFDAVSFDAPSLVAVVKGNGPTSGNARVTAVGLNFGATSLSAAQQIKVGQSTCRSTLWLSDSQLICLVPPGSQSGLSVEVQAGYSYNGSLAEPRLTSKLDAFTYDDPSVSAVLRTNGPTPGSSCTIFGANFAPFDLTPLARVGRSASESTSWQSDTSLLAASSAGSSWMASVSVTVGALGNLTGSASVGTVTDAFTFDRPVLVVAASPNLVQDSSQMLNISGSSYGLWDTSVSARISGTSTAQTLWISDAEVSCMAAAGMGRTLSAQLTASSLVGTATELLSYDAQLVFNMSRSNTETRYPAHLTAFGLGLGPSDSSVRSRVLPTASAFTMWLSTSSLALKPLSGLLGLHSLVITSLIATASADTLLSFDLMSMSHLAPSNSPKSSSSSMTMSGANFGVSHSSPATRQTATASPAVSWLSDSSIASLPPSGYDDANVTQTIVCSVSAQVAGLTESFSYDETVVSSLLPANGPKTGAIVSAFGSNFAVVACSGQGRLGWTSSESSEWMSDTAIWLRASSSLGSDAPLYFTVGGQQQASNSSIETQRKSIVLFTFDAPAPSKFVTTNFPVYVASNVSAGADGVLMLGDSFGAFDGTGQARVGGSSCQVTQWSSMTSLLVKLLPGYGRTIHSQVTVAAAVGSMLGGITFDSPSPVKFSMAESNQSLANLPLVGSTRFTVEGANFATSSATAKARVKHTASPSTGWLSTSSVVVKQVSFTEHTASVILSVLFLGYTLFQGNSGRTGGNPLLLSGSGLGAVDVSPKLRVASTACSASSWKSTSSVSCTVPAGSDIAAKVLASVVLQVGSLSNSFSYDFPSLSSLFPANVPPSAQPGQVVTAFGSNFLPWDSSPSLTIGSTACLVTQWQSDSSLLCTVGSGYSLSDDEGWSLQLAFFASNQTSSVTQAITYDALKLQSVLQPVAGRSQEGGFNVTVRGVNFGRYWATTSLSNLSCAEVGGSAQQTRMKLGDTTCQQLDWISDTALVCRGAPAGVGVCDVTAQLCRRSDVIPSAFAYPSPQLGCFNLSTGQPISCGLNTTGPFSVVNGPPDGSVVLTLVGSNFGRWDTSLHVRVGQTRLLVLSWSSMSSVICKAPAALPGEAAQVVLSVMNQMGTTENLFSFDKNVITSVSPSNAPYTPVQNISIFGSNFGVFRPGTIIGKVAGLTCNSTQWIASSAVVCSLPRQIPQSGASDVSMQVAQAVATFTNIFSFDLPVASSISPAQGSVTGGNLLEVLGKNFGSATSSLSIAIGQTSCPNSTWQSDSSATCSVPSASSPSSEPVTLKFELTGSQRVVRYNGSYLYFAETSTSFSPTSSPLPLSSTPPPVRLVEATCGSSGGTSSNVDTCSVTFSDGQGVVIPPGVWPLGISPDVRASIPSLSSLPGLVNQSLQQNLTLASEILLLEPTTIRLTLGKATVRLRVDQAIMKNAVSMRLAVMRFEQTRRATGSWVEVSRTVYNQATGMAEGETNAFSYFSAMLVPAAVPAVPAVQEEEKSSRVLGKDAIIGISAGGAVFLLAVFLLFWYFCSRRAIRKLEQRKLEERAPVAASARPNVNMLNLREMIRQEVQSELSSPRMLSFLDSSRTSERPAPRESHEPSLKPEEKISPSDILEGMNLSASSEQQHTQEAGAAIYELSPPLQEISIDSFMPRKKLGAAARVNQQAMGNASMREEGQEEVRDIGELVEEQARISSEAMNADFHPTPPSPPAELGPYIIRFTFAQDSTWVGRDGAVDMLAFSRYATRVKQDVATAAALPEQALTLQDIVEVDGCVEVELELSGPLRKGEGEMLLRSLARQVADPLSALRKPGMSTACVVRAHAQGPQFDFTSSDPFSRELFDHEMTGVA